MRGTLLIVSYAMAIAAGLLVGYHYGDCLTGALAFYVVLRLDMIFDHTAGVLK